ncbi:ectonucleotide pyrophosphatase/phosphodiesterase family member 5-like [Venturia canescens]|uniref:ectonucleotide pyrophosphatase/phosphodiesterase family member 5-like n=1 Tax=Venturia canescens TaxID=32260 RepID=UPI001C9C11E1|nr:ectonucleotide pyrophosphatase/phosphodiesterase family member 5-like [Venturia canescens]
MAHLIVIICVVYSLVTIQRVESSLQYPKLLVVSYDGFRYDYLNRNLTTFMNGVKNNGTYADYMINAFVTKTYPNHHTIATGFYTETHGVLDTIVYVANKTIGDSPELFQYDKNILPIWTINEQAGKGRHSGTVMWPGAQYKYNETSPAFVETFNMSVPWKSRIDSIISWFLHPVTPINFGVLYIEEPDFHGHVYGVNAPVINEMLKKLDLVTKYLHEKLQENKLDDVNVVHLSDHGMTSVTIDKIVNVSSYIGDIGYQSISKNTIIMITPDPGNEDIIYQKLKAAATETSKFDVYKRNEVPKRYHFDNNPRVGDIVVSAKSGYAFEDLYYTLDYYKKTFNITVNNQSEFGVHGYDNEDPNMHPIFFARGPAFVSECKLEPFHNVDLFPLFCNILELNCPPVNGTLESFSKCLKSSVHPGESDSNTIAIVIPCLLVIAGIILLVIYFVRQRRKFMGTQGRRPYEEIG